MTQATDSLRAWQNRLRREVFKVMNLWSDHPSVDLLLGAILVGVHLLVVYNYHVGNVLHWANQSQRLALYAAGAGMMALIAGFTGTAIAQYGSSSGPIVSAIRSAHGVAIRRNWLNIVAWLLVCTFACLIAMGIDGAKSPKASEWAFEAALALAATKCLRLLFLFGLILSSLDQEVGQPKRREIGLRPDLKSRP